MLAIGQEKGNEMFEFLTVCIFIWLLVKAIGLAFRLTWGIAKIIASILITLALPILILCLVFAGGIVLLVPIAIIGIAVGILNACV